MKMFTMIPPILADGILGDYNGPFIEAFAKNRPELVFRSAQGDLTFQLIRGAQEKYFVEHRFSIRSISMAEAWTLSGKRIEMMASVE